MTQDDDGGQHRAPDQGLLERIELSEPVRLRLYAVTVAVVALLTGYGLLDDAHATLWLAPIAAALGIGVTPWVRSAVVSPATAKRVAIDAAGVTEDEGVHPITAAGLALNWNGVRQPQ